MIDDPREALIAPEIARLIPLRQLAHLGDAVFALYEREREIIKSVSVKQMHERVAHRSSAIVQADLLEKLSEQLNEVELDIVRRARNIKAPSGRAGGQSSYRRATAFEALLGFLHLTSPERLRTLLAMLDPDSDSDKYLLP
jgi:ribonuclease III family protein